jgi:DNA-binding transcriptional MerR regulator
VAGIVKHYFTSDDLVRYTGLSRHMVNYLCRYGILEPTLSSERRRGLRRRFSYTDLLLGRSIGHLLSAGVSVLALRQALSTLRKKLSAVPLALFDSRSIAIVGNDVYISKPGQPPVELTADGQLAFQFVLDARQLQQLGRQSQPKKASLAN